MPKSVRKRKRDHAPIRETDELARVASAQMQAIHMQAQYQQDVNWQYQQAQYAAMNYGYGPMVATPFNYDYFAPASSNVPPSPIQGHVAEALDQKIKRDLESDGEEEVSTTPGYLPQEEFQQRQEESKVYSDKYGTYKDKNEMIIEVMKAEGVSGVNELLLKWSRETPHVRLDAVNIAVGLQRVSRTFPNNGVCLSEDAIAYLAKCTRDFDGFWQNTSLKNCLFSLHALPMCDATRDLMAALLPKIMERKNIDSETLANSMIGFSKQEECRETRALIKALANRIPHLLDEPKPKLIAATLHGLSTHKQSDAVDEFIRQFNKKIRSDNAVWSPADLAMSLFGLQHQPDSKPVRELLKIITEHMNKCKEPFVLANAAQCLRGLQNQPNTIASRGLLKAVCQKLDGIETLSSMSICEMMLGVQRIGSCEEVSQLLEWITGKVSYKVSKKRVRSWEGVCNGLYALHQHEHCDKILNLAEAVAAGIKDDDEQYHTNHIGNAFFGIHRQPSCSSTNHLFKALAGKMANPVDKFSPRCIGYIMFGLQNHPQTDYVNEIIARMTMALENLDAPVSSKDVGHALMGLCNQPDIPPTRAFLKALAPQINPLDRAWKDLDREFWCIKPDIVVACLHGLRNFDQDSVELRGVIRELALKIERSEVPSLSSENCGIALSGLRNKKHSEPLVHLFGVLHKCIRASTEPLSTSQVAQSLSGLNGMEDCRESRRVIRALAKRHTKPGISLLEQGKILSQACAKEQTSPPDCLDDFIMRYEQGAPDSEEEEIQAAKRAKVEAIDAMSDIDDEDI